MVLRDRFLRALVWFGAAGCCLSTETLGIFHQIRRAPLVVWWALVWLAALFFAFRRRPAGVRRWRRVRLDPVVLICLAGIAVILTLTAITSAFSPPNSADAIAYQLFCPRVVLLGGAIERPVFPTPISTRSCCSRLAEYLIFRLSADRRGPLR